ncbi:hypothetical protein CLV33_101149 [Jejuia pallidilutea]|uniref:Uncharacterized protein n=1 Tax=Jejuia pallidilutea TaxID=504487 RepID=A0A362X3A6_9FLAO|nr:hypothetical protein [Jejuia pallidilutea]PQV51227.1 hypothetical protein CLV33_101149 [Jejuia pallidilutea]
MTKDELIFELTATLNNVIDFVENNEEKAKEIYSKSQLNSIGEIWFSTDDLNEATFEELEEWYKELEEMSFMY